MRRKTGLSTFILAAMLAIGASHSAAAETVRAGGTGAATEMLKRLGAAFAASDEVKIEVVPSLGTSGALRAVADGALDIAVAGRSLRPEETAQGLREVFVVRSPFGLATSRPNPDGMKASEIAKTFASPGARWTDGTPIRLILRPKSDSDTPLLASLFPGMGKAIDEARRRPDVPTGATDQDNADLAESIPGSLAGAALTQVALEKRNLRFVSIDGVPPTVENLERGTYPYAKVMRLVTSAARSPAAARFIAFLASAEGKRLLRDANALPAAE